MTKVKKDLQTVLDEFEQAGGTRMPLEELIQLVVTVETNADIGLQLAASAVDKAPQMCLKAYHGLQTNLHAIVSALLVELLNSYKELGKSIEVEIDPDEPVERLKAAMQAVGSDVQIVKVDEKTKLGHDLQSIGLASSFGKDPKRGDN